MQALEKNIHEIFENAVPGDQFLHELVEKLETKEAFEINKTLLGLSICPDETNATVFPLKKYFPYYFFLGGLSGYPFTGKTGMAAFASHVPNDGNLLIIYGPHIGITRSHSGVGAIIRRDHNAESTCCGALISVLENFKSNNKPIDNKDDYQIEKIYTELYPDKSSVLKSNMPVLEITQQTYRKIEEKINAYSHGIKERFSIKKIALVGGIMINTDHGYPDFFEMLNYKVI